MQGRGKLADEIDRQYLSSARAASVLGWAPSIRLEDGLAMTAEWYREVLMDEHARVQDDVEVGSGSY